jgi:enamine deaminase RidA (YjgF/YER057c/UK114 family)
MTQSVVTGRRIQEWFHTLRPEPYAPIQSVADRLQAVVLQEDWPQVLEVRVFGSSDTFEIAHEILSEFPGSREWPISILDGSPGPEGGLAGIQLHLVKGTPVETVRLEGEVVGRAFEDEGIRYCILGGVGPDDPLAHPGEQTTSTLIRMESALKTHGMELKNLVRTWFFLDHILGWYEDFNRARTEVYRDRRILQGYVPASTGIGGRNHTGSALVASALAIRSEDPRVRVEEIPSPLQCPAGEYGSSFSRAAELTGPGFRRVLVSGTASIDPSGETAHVGRVEAQVRLTREVVRAILESREMGFEDVVRGNAYFKDPAQARALGPLLQDFGLPAQKLVVSRNTVCRQDLLFEMEVDAVRPTDGEPTS